MNRTQANRDECGRTKLSAEVTEFAKAKLLQYAQISFAYLASQKPKVFDDYGNYVSAKCGAIMIERGLLKICILNMLKKRQMCGYELMKKLEKYGWKPSPGSMYPLLAMLEKAMLIAKKKKGRKITYTISPKGKTLFDKMQKHRDEIFKRIQSNLGMMSHFLDENIKFGVLHTKRHECPEIMIPLLRTARKLMLCVKQGDKKKIEKLKKIILNSEKEIDKLLKK